MSATPTDRTIRSSVSGRPTPWPERRGRAWLRNSHPARRTSSSPSGGSRASSGPTGDIHLRERRIGRIVLCGVLTNICIYHTAADAHQHSYEIAVVRDGVAAVTDEEHEFALRQMERLFGTKLVDI
jgi:nicotinamidase-related amidase